LKTLERALEVARYAELVAPRDSVRAHGDV
jgi:hypothetical protein